MGPAWGINVLGATVAPDWETKAVARRGRVVTAVVAAALIGACSVACGNRSSSAGAGDDVDFCTAYRGADTRITAYETQTCART